MSATLDRLNQFADAMSKTPTVDVSQPVHSVATSNWPIVGRQSSAVHGTTDHPIRFVNTSDQVAHLGRQHFQEANYQQRVQLRAERTLAAARIPVGVVQDAGEVATGIIAIKQVYDMCVIL